MEINKNSNKEIINKNIFNKGKVQFWTQNPAILLDSDYITQLWISSSMSKNEKLNAITRLIIILSVFFYIFTKNLKILVSGLITLIVIIFIYYNGENDKKNESFANINNKSNEFLDKIYLDPRFFKQSTVNNPLSNVQPQEIIYDPKRKEAPPSYNSKVEEKINNNVKQIIEKNFNDKNVGKKLFNDLGDNLDFENSMRQFYSTSSTTIPNDQDSFLKFCYNDMLSCKDGDGLACSKNNYRHIRHN